jgi:hypothetical protein
MQAMRWSLALALGVAACGASVDLGNQNAVVDASDDAPPIDAAVIDAPPDARLCAGGDAAMLAPDGSCLVRFDTALTFADATAACTAFGARPAILTTAERDATARVLVGTANVWIGLHDQVTEGVFVWVDGTALGFSNFANGEPNNANNNFEEDCVIWAGNRPGWDDRPCAPIAGVNTPGEYPYLCMF